MRLMPDISFKYKAFISYSHQDKKWADWLHNALETYRIPQELVGKSTDYGEVPGRLFPVFRDREELPTSAELGDVINRALEQSSHLIVICSPRSARSQWVNEEILQFKRQGKADRILCLIVDGEPNASDKPELELEECFPEALKFELGQNGELTKKRNEPIAADVREGKDGKNSSLLKIVAGLLGVGFDDLRQREAVRQQKRMVTTAGVSVVLVAIMGILTFWALTQKREAEHQREIALNQREIALNQREIALNQKKEIEKQSYSISIALAQKRIDALEYDQARELLLETAKEFRNWEWGHLMHQCEGELVANDTGLHNIRDFVLSPDGNQLLVYAEHWKVGRDDRPLMLINLIDKEKNITLDDNYAYPDFAAFSPDGSQVSVQELASLGVLRLWSTTDGSELTLGLDQNNTDSVVSADFKLAAQYILQPVKKSKESDTTLLPPPRPDGNLENLPLPSMPDDFLKVGIKVYNVKSGDELLEINQEGLATVSFSPDNSQIALFGRGLFQVWSLVSGKALFKLQFDYDASSSGNEEIKFSPNGNWIVLKAAKRLRVLDASNGNELFNVQYDNEATSAGSHYSQCEFSPDSHYLVLNTGKRLKVLDVSNGKELRDLRGDSYESNWGGRKFLDFPDINRFLFSPDGKRLAATFKDSSKDIVQPVRIWNMHGENKFLDLKISKKIYWDALMAFSPNGKRLLTGVNGEPVKMWDSLSGKELFELMGHSEGLSYFEFTPDGRRVISNGIDGVIKIWDANNDRTRTLLNGHSKNVNSIDFSPDGKLIATGSNDESVIIWSATTGRKIIELRGSKPVGSVNQVSFSKDGKQVKASTGSVRLTGTNLSVEMLEEHSATGPFRERVWDVRTGKELKVIKLGEEGVRHLPIPPDGSRLLSMKTGQIRDANTGKELGKLDGVGLDGGREMYYDFRSISFSSDGLRILGHWHRSMVDDKIRIWDSRNGDLVCELEARERTLESPVFSPDCKKIITVGAEMQDSRFPRPLRIWNSDNGKELMTLEGSHKCHSPVFSPDGRRVFAIRGTGTIKSWSAESGKELLTINNPDLEITSLEFSRDGRQLAAAAGRTVKVLQTVGWMKTKEQAEKEKNEYYQYWLKNNVDQPKE
jgi:WD40 repeat protein